VFSLDTIVQSPRQKWPSSEWVVGAVRLRIGPSPD
jgi:hypothetical protein